MRAIALAATAAVVAAQGFGPINNLPVRMLSAFVLALLSPRQLLRFQGSVFTHIMSPHIQHGCLQGWNGTNSMYSGYITVNQTNGRALFFWFIESSVRSIFSSYSNLWQAVSPFYAERPSERPTGLLDQRWTRVLFSRCVTNATGAFLFADHFSQTVLARSSSPSTCICVCRRWSVL
jgi:hypothetical protein